MHVAGHTEIGRFDDFVGAWSLRIALARIPGINVSDLSGNLRKRSMYQPCERAKPRDVIVKRDINRSTLTT